MTSNNDTKKAKRYRKFLALGIGIGAFFGLLGVIFIISIFLSSVFLH